jgi:hypothetical protein
MPRALVLALLLALALAGALNWRIASKSSITIPDVRQSAAEPLERVCIELAVVDPEPTEPLMTAGVPGMTSTIDVQLEDHLAWLEVHAIAQRDGRALADIDVLAFDGALDPREDVDRLPRSTDLSVLGCASVTDERGIVRLELPASRAMHLELRAAHTLSKFARVGLESLTGGETRVLTVVLQDDPLTMFFGRTIDARSGDALVGAELRCVQPDARLPVTSVTSDADGVFAIAFSRRDALPWRVDAKGYGPAYAQPDQEHDTLGRAAVVELIASAALGVRVVARDAQPLSGIEVALSADGAQLVIAGAVGASRRAPSVVLQECTGATGHAHFSGLPARVPLRVQLVGRGLRDTTSIEPLVLEPGELRNVVWTFSTGCEVQGVLVDEFEQAVAGHEIWLLQAVEPRPALLDAWSELHVLQRTRSDAGGAFAFERVGAGDWWIAPASSADTRSVAEHVRVDARDGSLDVRLRLERARFITGFVQADDGTRVAGADIEALPLEQDLWRSIGDLRPRSDEVGSFTLGPLPRGRWSLRALARSKWTASLPVEVEAGASTVILSVSAGRRLPASCVTPPDRTWMRA